MNTTFLVDTLAGVTGGVASVCVGQPLDTVKVKMQLFPKMYGSMFSCVLSIARQQGLRGFYAGTVPALISNCADNAVMFGTYGQCQKLVAELAGVGSDTTSLNYVENAAAGSIASIFTSIVLCPTELVKIRMQCFHDYDTEVKLQNPSISETIKNIWKADGFKGLFRGMKYTFARESIGCSVFFGAYEWAREKLKPIGKPKENCDPLATMAAGALSGVVMWLVVYPIDVMKSRVQISEKTVGLQLVKDEIHKAGLRGLYCGLWPTLIKTVPLTAVLLFSVEFSKPFYNKLLSNNIVDPPKSNVVDDNFFSFCDFISGWTAGIISTCVGHPMDTVRVVQQVTNTSVITATRDLYKQDKLAGYFRGMMFPILSTGVVNSVFFGVNGNTMRLIQIYRSNGTNNDIDKDIRFCCDAENLNKYWHLDVFTSGCVAGLFYTMINIPNEVIKTMLQASNIINSKDNPIENLNKPVLPKITSPIKLVIELYKAHGIRSMYRGGTLLMLRDVPSMGIYMLTYEHSCCSLKKLWYADTKKESMPKYIQVLSGGIAGVVSWVLVLPFDVIKSKIIVDSLTDPVYKGAWDCAKKTYIEGGALRFFQGFWLLCLRAFPVNGITFFVYEMLLDTCNDNNNDKPATSVVSVKSKWS